ncbi:MAG: hypothetical protein IJ769_12780 [Clostridia bacterium]|nr:hypothetical protein [Clostridia bacterium]
MSRRRRPPLWPRIALLAAVAVVLVLIVAFAGRLLLGALSLLRADGGATERDPQFAEPAATVTRPPELSEEGEYRLQEDDPSSNWTVQEETPVDKTAAELSREAESGN